MYVPYIQGLIENKLGLFKSEFYEDLIPRFLSQHLLI